MEKRFFNMLAIAFWLAAMSWLVVVKVLPPLIGGDPPDYQSALARADELPPPVCWRMRWNDRLVGFAATAVRPASGGAAEMRSVVQFENLPLTDILNELSGGLAKVFQPMLGGENVKLDMTVISLMRFAENGEMQGFHTTIDLSGIKNFLQLKGQIVDGSRLRVVTEINNSGKTENATQLDMLTKEIELPRNAVINDALAPRTELKNLRIGQSWTIPVYRPFPPNSPVRIIHAHVERHDIVFWEGRPVETFLVVYREDAGSGVGAARSVIGRTWVRSDGGIVKQELLFSSLRFTLEQLPRSSWDNREEMLDDERFETMAAAVAAHVPPPQPSSVSP